MERNKPWPIANVYLFITFLLKTYHTEKLKVFINSKSFCKTPYVTKVQPNQPQATLQKTNEGISWKSLFKSRYYIYLATIVTQWTKITKKNIKANYKVKSFKNQHPYMKSKFVVRF